MAESTAQKARDRAVQVPARRGAFARTACTLPATRRPLVELWRALRKWNTDPQAPPAMKRAPAIMGMQSGNGIRAGEGSITGVSVMSGL
jgi:hypothetical protein